MKHIKTINKPTLQATLKKGGCGECQASCRRQSSLRTSEEIIFKRQETKRGENFPCAFLFGKEAISYEKFFAAAR